MSLHDDFPRTTCGCNACRVGCQVCPGPLIPGDLERIAAYRGHTDPDEVRTFAINNFCASDGGVIGDMVGGFIVCRRVPSVVPQQRPDGSCVFLGEAGECTIHPVSPFGCAAFDTHQTLVQAEPRSIAMMKATEKSPGYKLLWQLLAAANRFAPPMNQRKQAMLDGVKAVECDLAKAGEQYGDAQGR